jgi:hypothetical protein
MAHVLGRYVFRCRVLIRIAINNETEIYVLFTVYSRIVTRIAMCAIETNTSSSWYNRQKRITRVRSGSRERVHSGSLIRKSLQSTLPKSLLDHAMQRSLIWNAMYLGRSGLYDVSCPNPDHAMYNA